jgi:hypothetical protein
MRDRFQGAPRSLPQGKFTLSWQSLTARKRAYSSRAVGYSLELQVLAHELGLIGVKALGHIKMEFDLAHGHVSVDDPVR